MLRTVEIKGAELQVCRDKGLDVQQDSSSDDDSLYESALTNAISTAIEPTGFQELCRSLKGAPPATVARLLPRQSRKCLGEALPSHVPASLDAFTPEPHPVDFDWRFDAKTVDSFAQMVSEFEYVLCVGTPTVFDSLACAGRRVCLIDRNPFLTRGLIPTDAAPIIIGDIARVQLRHGGFDAVILDPPWYPAFYDVWLRKVIPLVNSEASIFLVLFRELTRPGASRERTQLLEQLASIGEVTFPGVEAVYSTPRFEIETLRRLQIPTIPAWRIGDVVRIKLFNGIKTWRFSNGQPPHQCGWNRFLSGTQVIALAVDQEDTDAISYRSPDGGAGSFELDSVSDRDSRRRTINIWTSRNRAAIVSGTARLARLMAAYTDAAFPKVIRPTDVSPGEKTLLTRLASELGLDFSMVHNAR